MKIGLVSTWFERGAAYVTRQYRQALEDKHEVFIYARGGERMAVGDPEWDGERVHWAREGVAAALTSFDLDDFTDWIRRNRLDAVWFNEQYWWEPVLACHGMGVKTGGFMVTYREDEIPLYGCFDFLTCNTHQFHELFAWHPQDYYIPWGTDLELFRPRQVEAVEPGYVTFFLSGGMNPPRKGADLLIRAFLKVRGPARAVIHSQVPLKNFLPDLEGAIEELRRSGRLQTYEETVGAPGLFHLGDVYVYPSRIDSLGLTVAEGLACGLPVIVPDHPPMNEFLDGSNGRRVRIASYYSRSDGHYWPQCLADVDDLAAQMQAYVDDAARIGEHKGAARAFAEEHLDWNKNGKMLDEIFVGARRLDSGEKEKAMSLARRYERERARLSVKPWLAYHYPRVAKLLKSGYRAFSGRSAGDRTSSR